KTGLAWILYGKAWLDQLIQPSVRAERMADEATKSRHPVGRNVEAVVVGNTLELFERWQLDWHTDLPVASGRAWRLKRARGCDCAGARRPATRARYAPGRSRVWLRAPAVERGRSGRAERGSRPAGGCSVACRETMDQQTADVAAFEEEGAGSRHYTHASLPCDPVVYAREFPCALRTP